MITDMREATWHAYRYINYGSHQCAHHARRMRHMLCAHCGQTGECEHLYFERCDCSVVVLCADCLFVIEGGLL